MTSPRNEPRPFPMQEEDVKWALDPAGMPEGWPAPLAEHQPPPCVGCPLLCKVCHVDADGRYVGTADQFTAWRNGRQEAP